MENNITELFSGIMKSTLDLSGFASKLSNVIKTGEGLNMTEEQKKEFDKAMKENGTDVKIDEMNQAIKDLPNKLSAAFNTINKKTDASN